MEFGEWRIGNLQSCDYGFVDVKNLVDEEWLALVNKCG